MSYLKKLIIYIKRHYDFLLVDLLAFALGYLITVQIRRSWHMPIHHGELFTTFGLVCGAIYLFVVLFSHNLNGIMARSFVAEFEAVFLQMLSTWAIFTVVLYLRKDANDFSRAVYFLTFIVCFIIILIFRSVWKFITAVGTNRIQPPKLLVVCDARKVETVLMRILPETYEGKCDIYAIIATNEDVEYRDHYPFVKGLSHLKEAAKDPHIDAAYVELENPDEETKAIKLLLKEEIIVYKGLGGGSFQYASQYITQFGRSSVLAIQGLNISLASKADRDIRQFLWGKRED